MKKQITFAIATILLAGLFIGLVSAQQGGMTTVEGVVYNSNNLSGTISNATVYVTCGTPTLNQTLSTQSLSNGAYYINFSESICYPGVNVSAYATKGGATSPVVPGVINTYGGELYLYLSIINLVIVPEFGIFTGIVALLGAVGIFFFVRRR